VLGHDLQRISERQLSKTSQQASQLLDEQLGIYLNSNCSTEWKVTASVQRCHDFVEYSV